LGALALLLSLAGCGGGNKQQNGSALASLDTRLTNSAGERAVPVKAAAQGTAAKPSAEASAANVRGHGVSKATQAVAAAAGKRVGGCAGGDLRYGDQWVSAMPDGLGLYPGARLVEAAGTDTGRCALRVASFVTTDSPEAVVTHYTASVRKAGFDAERQPCKTEIRLGGTRASDDAAYMLFARRNAKGVTEVDIVAKAGKA
jgi:hypothetical protein